MLTLAVQKSGRLYEGSMQLLEQIDIKLASSHNKLKAEALDFPIEVLFIRDDDVPHYVSQGVADVGIVGENVVIESKEDVQIVQKLGFSKCRLSLAVPKGTEYPGLQFFDQKTIATSYPVIVEQFFQKHNIHCNIQTIAGSVEIAPSIGLADGICDIVSSGSTLFMNNLEEKEVILKSEAVLIQHAGVQAEKLRLIQELQFRIDAVRRAKGHKYILMNVPNAKLNEVTAILPGMKSPTIMPLANGEWSSVHTVITTVDFWNIIRRLEQAGAEGILVLPIEKMVF